MCGGGGEGGAGGAAVKDELMQICTILDFTVAVIIYFIV